MKRLLLVLICGMILFGTIPVYGAVSDPDARITVNNLAPRTGLQYSVEPKPRKVDLLFDLREFGVGKEELERMIEEHVVPELEKKDLDFQIRIEESGSDPFVSFLGRYLVMVDHQDFLYLFELSPWSGNPVDRYFPYATPFDWSRIRITKPPIAIKAAYMRPSGCAISTSLCTSMLLYMVGEDGYLYEYSLYDNTVSLVPGIAGVKQVVVRGSSASSEVNYVLTESGELYARGYNAYGQLGVGDTENRTSFVRVPIPGKVAFFTASTQAAMAINDKGELYLFGRNQYNLLMQGSNVQTVPTPVRIAGIPKMKAGALGGNYGYLLDEDGKLWSWGNNRSDTLQSSNNVAFPMPVPIDKRFREVHIATGSLTNVLFDTESNVYIGGFNNGTNYTINFEKPAYRAKKIVAGEYCGFMWTLDDPYKTMPRVFAPLRVKDFSTGRYQILAVALDGTPLSGGNSGGYSLLGDGDSSNYGTDRSTFQEIYNLWNNDALRHFEQVFALPMSSFAIDVHGDVWAWGRAGDVYPSDYYHGNIPTKTRLRGVKKMFGVDDLIYALMENGDVYSWTGQSNYYDTYNALGHGKNVTGPKAPKKIAGLSNVVDLGVPAAKWFPIYAVTADGKLYGFGGGENGIEQIDAPPNLVQVEVNYDILMVLDAAGQVWAKGTTSYCLLTLGDQPNTCSQQSSPQFIPLRNLSNIKEISLGSYHALAIDKNDELWAWGYQTYGGELLNYGIEDVKVNHPVKLTSVFGQPLGKVKKIAAGDQISFVLDQSGFLWGGGYAYSNPGLILSRSLSGCSECKLGQMVMDFDSRPQYAVPNYREVVSGASWRNGSDKYYIALEDGDLLHHDDPRLFAEDVQALMTRDIRYIGIGREHLKDKLLRFISANNDRGLYLPGDDLGTALKRVGIHVAKNQSVDVHIHLGRTGHDDRDLIRAKFNELVRPSLEAYGIEARLTVTDGERKKENRLFYVSTNDGKLYDYDPDSKTSTLLIDDTIKSFAIGQDGSIYYHNQSGIYKFNEKLGVTVKLTDNVPESGHIAVDHDDNVYYVAFAGYSAGVREVGLHRLNGRTGDVAIVHRNKAISYLSSSYHGKILFACYNNYADNYQSACMYDPDNGFKIFYHSPSHQVIWNNENYIFAKSASWVSWYYESPLTPEFTYWRKQGIKRPFLFPNSAGVSEDRLIYPSRINNVYYFSKFKFNYLNAPVELWYDGLLLVDGNTLSQKKLTNTLDIVPDLYAETPDLKLYFSENGVWKYFDPAANKIVTIGNLPVDTGVLSSGMLFYPQGSYDETKWIKKTEIQSELQTAQWRTEADRFYVNISDGSLAELTNSSKRNTIIQHLSDTGTVYVQLGRAANKAQAEQVIQQVGYGAWIDNTDLDAAFGSLATFLVENAGLNRAKATGKVILEYDPDTGTYMSDKLVYETGYEDPENDSKFTHAWKFDHDPGYYENALGLLDDAGKWLPSPYEFLTKPGKYTLTYAARDNPKSDYRFDEFRKWGESQLELLAHRRPIAAFVPKVMEAANGFYTVSITESSYDPDRQSTANRGIAEKVWKWKKASDTEWTSGMIPGKVPAGDVYFISLTVRDTDGAWSHELIRDVFAGGDDQPPIAGFTVDPAITYRGVQVAINSQASDQEDGDRTKLPHVYYIKNLTLDDAETVASTSRTSWTKTFNSVGTFRIRQVVTDSAGQSAEAVRTVTILNRKPAVNVTTPASADPANPTKLTVLRPTFAWSYSDADGDAQKQFQVQIYRMDGTLVQDSGTVAGSAKNWTPTANLPEKVQMYIQVRAHDGYDWSDWSAPKYFFIETNRPPTADFDWTPKPVYEGDTVRLLDRSSDPDGDALAHDWSIAGPGGVSFAFTSKEPSFRAEQPGNYAIRLTVGDGKATAQANRTLHVLPLEIAGEVLHTPEWRENHLAAGHEVERDPKDFYSGEIIRVAAEVSAAPVSAVTAELRAVSVTGAQIRKKVTLAAAGGLRYEGELHDKVWMSPEDGIREGGHVIVFRAEYQNGVVKETSVPIRIIGNIYRHVSVHRVQ